MSLTPDAPPGEVAVKARIKTADLYLFGFCAGLVALATWVVAAWGNVSFMMLEQSQAVAHEREVIDTQVWIWVAVILFTVLLIPLWKGINLLRGQVAVRVGATGIKLYEDSLINARAKFVFFECSWAEVDRLVIWRKPMNVLGFTAWETKLGIGRTTASSQGPETGAPQPDELPSRFAELVTDLHDRGEFDRPSSMPNHLDPELDERSIAFSFKGARALAEAVTNFAPHVTVVDERHAGLSRRIEPNGTDKRTY